VSVEGGCDDIDATLVDTLRYVVSSDLEEVVLGLDDAVIAVMVGKGVVQDVDKAICYSRGDKRAREVVADGMAWGRAAVTTMCRSIVRVRAHACGRVSACGCIGWGAVRVAECARTRFLLPAVSVPRVPTVDPPPIPIIQWPHVSNGVVAVHKGDALLDLVRHLYHLRRGVLLGDVLRVRFPAWAHTACAGHHLPARLPSLPACTSAPRSPAAPCVCAVAVCMAIG
jgi:hypothetical protein